MSMIINIKESHPFFTSANDVDMILRPLKESFNISSLVYQRNFNDGSEIRLSNQPDWIKYFYEQGYILISGFEKHPTHYQSSFVVWSHLSHHQPILQAARGFNIDHGVTIIEKTEDGCEFFFLGTTPDKPYVANLLINNLELLQRFILYFKQQAAPLLKTADSNRIIIPHKYQHVNSDERGIPFKTDTTASNTKQLFKLKKFSLDNSLSLSMREINCAQLLIQGKSARLIAQQLFISPRTVETHVQNIKDKLHCYTKAELINKLLDLKVHLI